MQMGAVEIPVEQRDHLLGTDEFDAVVTAEMAAFVVVQIRIAHRVTLVGIENQGPVTIGELAVGHQVGPLVSNQPQTGDLALAGPEAIIGIAKSPVVGGIGRSALDNLADGRTGKVNIASSSSRNRFGKIAQMHRQFRRDLEIAELIEKL